MKRLYPVLLILLALPSDGLRAQKTDVVVLENGDRITGEIKELYRGKLSYSTDDMGTISIEWQRIQQITSQDFFEFELGTGDRYFGLLEPAAEPRLLVVTVAEFSDTLAMSSVVRVVPIETNFFQRLKGRIDFGFTFLKANHQTEFTLSGNVDYRVRRALTGLDYSFYLQSQDSTGTITRNSAGLRHQRFWESKWSALTSTKVEQNSELSLDLRYSVLGGGAYSFIRTNKAVIQSLVGLNYTNEKFTDSESRINSLEGVIGTEGAYFLFDSPKTDIDATLVVYPNLTTWGRVRIAFETRLSYEILSDFTIGFTVFDDFDSGAPGANASSNDFGTTVTVGYKF